MMADLDEPLEDLRRGDPRAFDLVYTRYRPRVFGFLHRLAGDPMLAEDLLQETFVKLARHAPRLLPDTNLRAWLFTVARNAWRSHRRWLLLDAERLRAWGLWPGRAAWEVSPDDHFIADETARRTEAALRSLPPNFREVLLLVCVEQLPPAEVADVLGLKAEAVRQRLSRARSMLAAQLERV